MYHQQSEPVTLSRDCDAIMIPAGNPVTLPTGSIGYITQALGGSFTLYLDGNLFRVAGHDAEALGKEAPILPEVPDDATNEDIEAVVWKQLKTCFDPEIPIDITELGLVYRCEVSSLEDDTRTVEIDMTLTAPGCGMGEIIVADVRDKLLLIPTVSSARVELVFDPPWNQGMMSEAARLQTGMMY